MFVSEADNSELNMQNKNIKSKNRTIWAKPLNGVLYRRFDRCKLLGQLDVMKYGIVPIIFYTLHRTELIQKVVLRILYYINYQSINMPLSVLQGEGLKP